MDLSHLTHDKAGHWEYTRPRDLNYGLNLIRVATRAIDFSDMDLKEDAILEIVEELKERDCVYSLDMSGNYFGDKGAIAIASFVKQSSALENLDLSKNAIGNDGAKALAEAMKENKSLVRLSLTRNRINNTGVKIFAKSIEDHPSLMVLKMANNLISGDGLLALADCLELNPEIIVLTIKSELVADDKIVKLIDQRIKRNKDLKDKNQKERQQMLKEVAYSEEEGRWRRCRLMVIGEGRAGKTATVRNLLDLKFDASLDSTVVGQVTEVCVRNKGWEDKKQSKVKLDYSSSVALRLVEDKLGRKYRGLHLKEEKERAIDQKAEDKKAELAKFKREQELVDAMTPEEFRKLSPVKKRQMRDMIKRVRDRKKARIKLPATSDAPKPKERKFREPILKKAKTKIDMNSLIPAAEFKKLPLAEKRKWREKLDKLIADQKAIEAKPILDSKMFNELTSNGRFFRASAKDLPNMHFSIWDLGGQEVFHTIHHLFLNDASVYVLAVDIRKLIEVEELEKNTEFLNHLDFWSRSLASHAPNSPVLIAATFADDLVDTSMILDTTVNDLLLKVNKNLSGVLKIKRDNLVMNVGNSTGQDLLFYPIDNKNHIGVTDLKLKLLEVAEKQPFVNLPMKLRWLRILDEIVNDVSNKFIEQKREKDHGNGAVEATPETLAERENLAARRVLKMRLQADRTFNALFGAFGMDDVLQEICNYIRNDENYLELRNLVENPANGIEGVDDAPTAVGQVALDLGRRAAGAPERVPQRLKNFLPQQQMDPALVTLVHVGPMVELLLVLGNINAANIAPLPVPAPGPDPVPGDIPGPAPVEPGEIPPVDGPVMPNIPGVGLVMENVRNQLRNMMMGPGEGITMANLALRVARDKRFNGWITYSQFVAVAKNFGISNPKEIDEMLNVFSSLGAVLYYDSSASLRDIITIDIMWLIKSLGKVVKDADLHRATIDMTEITNKKLNDDVDLMFDRGLISYDLLEYFWGRNQEISFLIDFMKQSLLISEWGTKSTKTEILYLLPSLLSNDKKKWQANVDLVAKSKPLIANFKFENSCLPDGIFERLLCLVTSLRDKDGKNDFIMKDFCRLWLTKNAFTKHLFEVSLYRDGDSIIMACFDEKFASHSRLLVDRMLLKIKSDARLSEFTWKVEVSVDENKFVSLEEAKKKDIQPWCNDSTAENRAKLDIGGFLADF